MFGVTFREGPAEVNPYGSPLGDDDVRRYMSCLKSSQHCCCAGLVFEAFSEDNPSLKLSHHFWCNCDCKTDFRCGSGCVILGDKDS
jgi:hypothetical protein